MKKPMFFIIGAPKCGTTSLWRYLADHPSVFLPTFKEPHFFNSDHNDDNFVRSIVDYEALFQGAGESHLAVGEASVLYLYSRVAVQSILQYQPTAKFIAMLRNPIEMVYSLHADTVFGGDEQIVDFRSAWNARSRGFKVGRSGQQKESLLYGDVCKLGEQVERLYKTVPRCSVLLVFFEDFIREPKVVYRRVLEFLNLPDDNRQSFPIHNPNKVQRSSFLGSALQAVTQFKRARGINVSTGLLGPLHSLNRMERPRAKMDEDLRAELAKYFERDIDRLSLMTGRELSYWINDSEQKPMRDER